MGKAISWTIINTVRRNALTINTGKEVILKIAGTAAKTSRTVFRVTKIKQKVEDYIVLSVLKGTGPQKMGKYAIKIALRWSAT